MWSCKPRQRSYGKRRGVGLHSACMRYQPSLGEGKNGQRWSKSKKNLFDPPHHLFLRPEYRKSWKRQIHVKKLSKSLKTLNTHQKTVIGPENSGSVHYFRLWKPESVHYFQVWKPGSVDYFRLWKPEVFTIFGYENPGSVHYFRIWKPRKCSIFSVLKPGSVYYFRDWKAYTIFGTGNLGSLVSG